MIQARVLKIEHDTVTVRCNEQVYSLPLALFTHPPTENDLVILDGTPVSPESIPQQTPLIATSLLREILNPSPSPTV
ncbi:MAG: hypothetical protein QG668_138 [Patescibacteria group bacterium]|nr:hypothetical protein [Patescibacteria group bacterium]